MSICKQERLVQAKYKDTPTHIKKVCAVGSRGWEETQCKSAISIIGVRVMIDEVSLLWTRRSKENVLE